MRNHLAPSLSAVLLLVTLTRPDDAARAADHPAAQLLGPVPTISLDASAHTATNDEKRRIAALIDRLKEIKDPDYGFSPWMGGDQFAPIKDSGRFGAGVIMINHGLKTSDALEQLVALGPKAISQLLARLTDATPTRLVMEHGGGMGAQWYGREISMNTASPVEQQVQAKYREFVKLDADLGADHAHVSRHVVTIGDVCFVIIGQIVNRPYQSARYQPTMCRVINSPTHTPQLAEVVRAIWTDPRPAQRLIDSLLLDLYTKDADGLQGGAAMRLLFYFPKESEGIIAKRLAGFDVRKSGGDYSVVALLKAVRPFARPSITDELLRVVKQTDDPGILESAVTDAVVRRAPDLVFERMKRVLSVAPPAHQGPFGGEYDTLKAAARYFPEKSEELFKIYRNHRTIETLRSAIHALEKPAAPHQWMNRFLSSLLDDKRDTGWEYGPNYDRQPIRICDEAAKTLADYYLKGVRFEYEKTPAHLDQEIAKIKRVLAGERDVSFARPAHLVVPADLPQREAERVIKLEERTFRVYAFSNDDLLWVEAISTGPAHDWETLKINSRTGGIIDHIPRDRMNGDGSQLPNGPADREFYYDGFRGGPVQILDVRTGRLITKLPTPFHAGGGFDDPLQTRAFGGVTPCGPDSEWIVAITGDGTLHSIEVKSGRHRIEWKEKMMFPSVIGVRGTSRVLVENMGGDPTSEDALRVWDQSSRTLQKVTKVPNRGWRDAWGDFAWNDMNSHATLWNIAKAREIQLPESGAPVEDIDSNKDQTLFFVLRQDGSVELFRFQKEKSLKPILRLVPPTKEELAVSIVPGDDKRHLFWLGQPRDRRNQKGRRVESAHRTVIAVFDYGAVVGR